MNNFENGFYALVVRYIDVLICDYYYSNNHIPFSHNHKSSWRCTMVMLVILPVVNLIPAEKLLLSIIIGSKEG